jgi:pimeloyl-ACP methyl ester carboxylesterase
MSYTDSWTDGHGTVKYFSRSDGSRLRYFTAGSGPALVLMHTIRTQLDYFQRVIPQLWDSFTVYALDLPGMGWSDIVPGARYEEPVLRAASGLERGNLFARFIISSVRMPILGPVFASLENRPIMKGVMRGGVVDKATLPEDFIAALRHSGRRKGYSRVARAVYRSLKGFAKARDRYPDVSVPVTLVYSDDDWSRPAERQHVASLLAEVERVTLPNTGHFSALERPKEMARILRRSN